MYRNEISISIFSRDISTTSEYEVDVNTLLGVCGASPIRVHYKTDRVMVSDTYPESILLASGSNYITINQIQKIIKTTSKDDKATYEIVCGRLKTFKTTVKITQI